MFIGKRPSAIECDETGINVRRFTLSFEKVRNLIVN